MCQDISSIFSWPDWEPLSSSICAILMCCIIQREMDSVAGVLAAATLIPRYGSKGHASTALAKLDAARGHKSRRLAGQPPGQIPQAKRQRGSKDFKDMVNSDAVLAPNPEVRQAAQPALLYAAPFHQGKAWLCAPSACSDVPACKSSIVHGDNLRFWSQQARWLCRLAIPAQWDEPTSGSVP